MQIETSTITPYGKIYRLTNKVNGKMYHGQTIEENINDRWDAYKRLNCKGQKKLYNALKKYGPENFLFEIIDTTPQNQQQLDNLEIKYIADYDTMNNGYNCDPGGRGGHRSEETKKKISISHKGIKNPMFGKPLSEEHKRKISEANSGNRNGMFGKKNSETARKIMSKKTKGINHPMFGKKHSKETKDKMSKALKGKLNPQFGKQLSDETKYKISKSMIGVPRSEETKRKISEGHKRKHILSL